MYYNYILKSEKDRKWYTGVTSDLRKRFSEHNNDQVRSTKSRGPFSIIYYEACLNRYDALAREKYLKSGPGKRYLKNRLKRFLFLTGRVYPVRGKLLRATASSNGGYIALISVIIISALLIAITAALSFSGFFSRFTILEDEYKEVSSGLAEACGDVAILRIAENPFYTGGATTTVGNNTCSILSVATSSPAHHKLIKTQAIFQNSYTNLEIVASTSPHKIDVISWKEVAEF